MRLSERGFTLPWQLVELQEPGPVYLLASAGGFAAHTGLSEAKKIAPRPITAQRSVNRLASGPILIPVLGWSPALFAQAVEPARVRNFYTARKNRSQPIERSRFPKAATKSKRVHYQNRFPLDMSVLIIVYT